MSDERPSIAELKMMCDRDTFTDEGAIIDAAPVLLEIAAAALGLETRFDFSESARRFHDPEMQRLIATLAKVRP